MIYIKLLWSFIKIGFCTIGGGYSAIALIEDIVVKANQWISMEDFLDIVAIAEMTPGPIAINSATFVGTRVSGFLGAIVATLGFVLPSFLIVMILAFFYYKYRNLVYVNGMLKALRAAIVAIITNATISILKMSLLLNKDLGFSLSNIDFIAVVCFAVSLLVLRVFKKLSPILVILLGGLGSTIAYYLLSYNLTT